MAKGSELERIEVVEESPAGPPIPTTSNGRSTRISPPSALELDIEKEKPRTKKPRGNHRSRNRGRSRDNLDTDKDEPLPKKVKWAIVITAVFLLGVSFLLVGITLRLAPLIDEMVRQENERLLSLLTQPGSEPQGGVQESDNAFSSTSTNPSTETPGPVPVQADVHAGGEA